MSAIQEIHGNIKKENGSLGDEMVAREFNRVVLSHILKHFYGFELLIAPYAIAHLKLTLEVERLGFDFANTKDDADKDNDRFKVYLANTLDDPNKPPAKLFGFDSIPQESESAREVKKNVPILAIVGNPPYSNFGRMNRGEWILNLLKDYKKGLKERKINIDDDFIKFIRFAQWKLEQTGKGIFAMITSNTFIDGITHRQMRHSLMDTFDEIYIYNLHGNSRKGETAPDGGKDENVFNIQQGVSINIFVKFPEKQKETIVKYCDLWGLREHKFSILLDERFEDTKWKVIPPKEPNWFFADKDTSTDEEYQYYSEMSDIFMKSGSGIITRNDDITIQFEEKSLIQLLDDFRNLTEAELRSKYHIKDGVSWKLTKAVLDVKENRQDSFVLPISYHPFDYRFTYLTDRSGGFLNRPIYEIMKHMRNNNLGLSTTRNQLPEHNNFLVTKYISNTRFSSKTGSIGADYLYPIYLYEKPDTQLSLTDANREGKIRKPNLKQDFIKILSKKIGLDFISDGSGDLEKTVGPEAVFYYAYAIFHSPTYRSRYAEQLKIDFPRLPLTSDKKLFAQLVRFGNELVNLHLLGENPFDKSKTIFDEPEKWGVKIGGTKPENLIDWKVADVRYNEKDKRVYVNKGQYFEDVEKEVWEFMIGGYQVCEKWLKDRKKAERSLSTDDLKHYMKMVVAIRETIRLMADIDYTIRKWPIE